MTTTSRRACAPTHDCSSASGSTSPRARSCSSTPSTSTRRSCGRSPRRPTPPAPAMSTSSTGPLGPARVRLRRRPTRCSLDAAVDGAAARAGDRGGRGRDRHLGGLGRGGARGHRRRSARARSLPRLRPAWMDGVMDRRSRGRSSPTRPRAGRARRSGAGPRALVGRLRARAAARRARSGGRVAASAWTSSRPAPRLTARGFTALRYRGPGTDWRSG